MTRSPMTRLFALATVVVASAAIAGCGGGDSSTTLSPQLEAALKYLPKDSAVVVVVPTDLKSGPLQQLDQLGSSNVKGWDKIRKKIEQEISQSGSQSEVQALLGNPIAVSQSGPKSDDQNIALQVQNASSAKATAQKSISKGEAKQLPEYNGAFVWQDTDSNDEDTNFNGLKGNMMFAADTEQLLHEAIDNAGGSNNANSNNDFKSKLDDMGDNSLTRVVGDAQQLLANAGDTQQAEKVKFVKALGLFWSKSSVTSTGLSGQTILQTDNESLSEEDLPLTTDSTTLTLPATNPVYGVALAEPDQLVKFAINAAQQANPQSAGQVQQALGQLKSVAGVDLHKDLLGVMQQVSVAFTGREQYEFRVQLADGKQFGDSLTKSQTFLQGALSSMGGDGGALTLKTDGDAAWSVVRAGDEVARFAVKGNTLVGSIGPVGDLPSPTASEPIEGQGALGFESDISKLVGTMPASQLGDGDTADLAREVLSSFGPSTNVASETTDQITINSSVQLGD